MQEISVTPSLQHADVIKKLIKYVDKREFVW